MAFQSTVRSNMGYGVPGEIRFDGPLRAQPFVISPAYATPANIVVGRVFTLTDLNGEQVAVPGGTGIIAGVLANPKVYAGNGTIAGGSLAATLQLLPGVIGEFVTMGFIAIASKTAANVGDLAYYDTTTGEISCQVASNETPPVGTVLLPNAVVDHTTGTTPGGIAVLRLTN